MDKPTPKERVQHVLDSITSIRSFMEHITFEMFSSDKLLQNGVKYEFLIIGEAIRHIDQDILDKYEYPRIFQGPSGIILHTIIMASK